MMAGSFNDDGSCNDEREIEDHARSQMQRHSRKPQRKVMPNTSAASCEAHFTRPAKLSKGGLTSAFIHNALSSLSEISSPHLSPKPSHSPRREHRITYEFPSQNQKEADDKFTVRDPKPWLLTPSSPQHPKTRSSPAPKQAYTPAAARSSHSHSSHSRLASSRPRHSKYSARPPPSRHPPRCRCQGRKRPGGRALTRATLAPWCCVGWGVRGARFARVLGGGGRRVAVARGGCLGRCSWVWGRGWAWTRGRGGGGGV
jgi:hypothetical protein